MPENILDNPFGTYNHEIWLKANFHAYQQCCIHSNKGTHYYFCGPFVFIHDYANRRVVHVSSGLYGPIDRWGCANQSIEKIIYHLLNVQQKES